jgi:soluble lytic murein transglycosylase-like protein
MKHRIYLALVFWLIFGSIAYAQNCGINMRAIQTIESHGNPRAYNKGSQARGLYQITPICLKEYNQFHTQKYTVQELFNPDINGKIATWYLTVRIQQMLRHYKISVTVENILWAYNAGISNVIKRTKPTETANYIKKYNTLKGGD